MPAACGPSPDSRATPPPVRSPIGSKDGEFLYGLSSSGVTRFARDPLTGRLTYKGCITGDTFSGPSGSGACSEIPSAAPYGSDSGLADPTSLAISPDGEWLYVGGASTIARFARDPAMGALVYRGCITGNSGSGPAGSGACLPIHGLFAVYLAMNPDGRFLYAAGSTGISTLVRDRTTGVLSFRGCITGDIENGPSGSVGCSEIPSASRHGALSGVRYINAVTMSPDGNSIYTAADRDAAVARFAPAPQTRITSAPRREIRKRRAAFKFRSGEPSTFECKLKGRHVRSKLSHWRRCGSESLGRRGKRRYRHLRPGQKVFRVRATNAAGTTDPTPAKRRWRVK